MPTKSRVHVELYFSTAHIDELQLKDKNVVVIDVLRASTTITHALYNGAKEIIPVSDIESAVKISGSLFGDVTLRGGERNGRRIEGFNLGNSPSEYSEQTVKGKSIIYMTTNGTTAIVRGRYAKNLLIASFVNLAKIVRFLQTLKNDFTILCAGKEMKFCLEDAVCAGALLDSLEAELDTELVYDDAGTSALALYKTFGKSISKMLKQSEHGRYLTEIGFGDDLKICAQANSLPVVPMLRGSIIRLYQEANTSTKKTAS